MASLLASRPGRPAVRAGRVDPIALAAGSLVLGRMDRRRHKRAIRGLFELRPWYYSRSAGLLPSSVSHERPAVEPVASVAAARPARSCCAAWIAGGIKRGLVRAKKLGTKSGTGAPLRRGFYLIPLRHS